MAVAGAPSVEHELRLSHRGYVLFAFALPLVAAAVLEAGVALLSDVWDRARLVVLGQATLALSLAFTAWTSSPWGLTLGLALAGATSGVACSAAQAILVAGAEGDADRTLVRWSIFGSVGDVLTPLVTAAAIALGHSYRGAMAAVAVFVAIQCVLSARLVRRAKPEGEPSSAETPDADDPPEVPLRVALRRALRMPRLWTWLLAAASCTLLDELVLALSALRLQGDRGASAALAAAVAVCFSLGTVAGDALADRVVERVSPRRVLVVSAVLCGLAVGALVAVGGTAATCVVLFAAGVACAPHHPLAMARAYAELPDHPGTVQAVGQVFVVVEVGAPVVLGLVADRFGLGPALACLAVQPLVILVCALALRSPPKHEPPG
ncbi:MAG TPA: MFS transporter [Polyangiaceae bacterium]